MDNLLLQYLNNPFRSTRYKKIGFTMPQVYSRTRSKSKKQQASLFPLVNQSFFDIPDSQTEEKIIIRKRNVQSYLDRFVAPENASKSKMMRDLDYRTQVMRNMRRL